MLPLWSAELIELRIHPGLLSIPIEFGNLLYQSFLKLEYILFKRVENLTNNEFVKRNPHMKKHEFLCCELLDDNIFRSIAESVTGIKAMQIDGIKQTDESNFQGIRKLSNLKWFGIWFMYDVGFE